MRRLILALYILFLLVPIYWLVNMSLKTNTEIVTTMNIIPAAPTLDNYRVIFTDPAWYSGYINSITYVVLNTVISIIVSKPRKSTTIAPTMSAAPVSGLEFCS